MSIKVKLIILTALSLIVTGVMGFILFQNTISAREEVEKQGILNEIRSTLLERIVLRDEYLLYREERPIIQLKVTSEALEQLFIQQSTASTSTEEQILVNRLGDNNKLIDQAMSQIITNLKSEDASSSAGVKEVEQELISQIFIKSQESVAITQQLLEASRSRVVESQQRATVFVLVSITGIVLVIIVALYSIWLSIAKPLITLKEDVVRIASLDFSTTSTTTTTTTGVASNDEIGQLANAFKKMVEKLKESYTGLDRKVKEKTKELEEAKAKDEAMIASIGDGLIAVDNEGKVMVVNKVAEDMLDWKAKDLTGRIITGLPLEDGSGHLIPLDKRPTTIALSTGKTTKVIYFFVRKDKTRFPMAITATPIKHGGKTIGLVEIIRDVTQELEIDRAKSEFVSLASHQLRTPLGIVKWYLEALEGESYIKKSPIMIRNYFDEIYKSNERVLSLVRDLLSVSRIDQGRVKNTPTLVNIPELLTTIVKEMQIVAQQKKISLSLDITKSNKETIPIDALRFHEVVQNLIANALQYTNAGGRVDVSLGIKDAVLLLSVKDTGIGIAAVDQKKLFVKFFRTGSAIAKNMEGSGLGLYVVKSYVEGWGGSISVESVEGKGSTFTISLPISQSAKLRLPIPQKKSVI